MPPDSTADGSPHASLTLCEFLRTHRRPDCPPCTRNDTAYVFSIRLSRPCWEDGDAYWDYSTRHEH